MARQAGEIQCQGFGEGNQIYHKGAIDIVTDVDRRAEAFLLDEIQRRFPDDSVVAEESGGVMGQDCCVWYIDPLDGTVNYAHNLPIFCVSIAYAQAGELRLGVVYDPVRNECFQASRGQGSWLNGVRLQVSERHELDQSLLVTGFPYDIRTNPVNNLEQYALFALRSQGVRRLGSAALDLCYVAAGRFDGYWELSVESWDLAAGTLIAQEAGALVTATDGTPDYLSPPCSVLAANPALHAHMLEVLQESL
jgi:myo-inositol-1(or 4)-monophosphatase